MAATTRTRKWMLGVALLATLLAVIWAYQQTPESAEEAVVAPIKHNALSRSVSGNPAHLALEKLQRSVNSQPDDIADAFRVTSWFVAPPVPKVQPVAAQPAPPTAPPLPFTYLGQMLEDGKLTVFLTRQNMNYSVKVGETIEDMYHVDSIESQRIVFTYKPLNMQQSLAIGNIN